MTKYQKKGYKGGVPSKPGKNKKPSPHLGCSKKRTILKDRIRELETRIITLVAHVATIELYLEIHDSNAEYSTVGENRTGESAAVQLPLELFDEEE